MDMREWSGLGSKDLVVNDENSLTIDSGTGIMPGAVTVCNSGITKTCSFNGSELNLD